MQETLIDRLHIFPPPRFYAMLMSMIFARLFILLLCLSPAPVFAQAVGETPRDSNYFMMDDNKQSPEEMAMEAEYVYDLCNANGYQATYFNCSCLAGAFLQERERLGPMVLQQDIIYELTKSRDAQCANTAVIAGNIYMNCMNFADVMRELATDNEQICACAANRAAQEFERAPRLNVSYINSLRRRAMQYCFNPRNRTFGGTLSSTETR